MKIIDIHKNITNQHLLNLLNEKLDDLFENQRHTGIHFENKLVNGNVEIYAPGVYPGFLFQIAIAGTELHITRSEHYVDDVNSLTVESILNEIFEELAKDGDVTFVLEG